MAAALHTGNSAESTLKVYLLGSVDFEEVMRLQRLLHFEVTGDRGQAALILCEHPPGFTVGRLGSRSQIRVEQQELRWRGWPIRWVNRGGGCMFHLPGQLALYSVLPLDALALSIDAYLENLGAAICDLLADFSVHGEARRPADGVWVGDRMLASLGVSVRDWVTSFGACINIDPTLDPFRQVDTSPGAPPPMTSLVRERGGPVRSALVRERLIEHFRTRFGFGQVTLFTDHPSLHTATPVRSGALRAREGV